MHKLPPAMATFLNKHPELAQMLYDHVRPLQNVKSSIAKYALDVAAHMTQKDWEILKQQLPNYQNAKNKKIEHSAKLDKIVQNTVANFSLPDTSPYSVNLQNVQCKQMNVSSVAYYSIHVSWDCYHKPTQKQYNFPNRCYSIDHLSVYNLEQAQKSAQKQFATIIVDSIVRYEFNLWQPNRAAITLSDTVQKISEWIQLMRDLSLRPHNVKYFPNAIKNMIVSYLKIYQANVAHPKNMVMDLIKMLGLKKVYSEPAWAIYDQDLVIKLDEDTATICTKKEETDDVLLRWRLIQHLQK